MYRLRLYYVATRIICNTTIDKPRSDSENIIFFTPGNVRTLSLRQRAMHQWRCGDESSHLLSNHLARRAPNRYIRLSLAWLYKPRKRVSVFFPFFPVKHHSAVNASGLAMSPFILDHWMTTTFEVLGWIFPFSSRDRQMWVRSGEFFFHPFAIDFFGSLEYQRVCRWKQCLWSISKPQS